MTTEEIYAHVMRCLGGERGYKTGEGVNYSHAYLDATGHKTSDFVIVSIK